MPNSKQRRDQARRHLERQLVRRQQRDVRRRKLNLIGTVVGVLALFAVVITTVVMLSNDNKDTTADPAASSTAPSASTSPSASGSPLPSRKPGPIASPAARKTSGPCKYAEDAAKLTAGNLFDVGLPPDPAPTPTRNATALFTTNQGLITVTLDGASAPCNVQSIEYLIGKKFYDNTACPRSVNSGIFVVQSATPPAPPRAARPTPPRTRASPRSATPRAPWRWPTPDRYQRQPVLLHHQGLERLAGQELQRDRPVTGGLDVLKKVATGGDDGSNQAGGGKPNVPLYFKTVPLKS